MTINSITDSEKQEMEGISIMLSDVETFDENNYFREAFRETLQELYGEEWALEKERLYEEKLRYEIASQQKELKNIEEIERFKRFHKQELLHKHEKYMRRLEELYRIERCENSGYCPKDEWFRRATNGRYQA